MAAKIIVLFNLKPGVDRAAYEAWARATDLPTVNGLGSVAGFEVLRAQGLLGSEAAPPYAYIEILEVKDMEAFGRDIATQAMREVAAAFQSMADAQFILTEALG